MNQPPPIPGQRPDPVPLKASKKNRLIGIAAIVLLSLPTVGPSCIAPFIEKDEPKPEPATVVATTPSSSSSGCGWGGCKDDEEEEEEPVVRKRRPLFKEDLDGSQAKNAALVKRGMSIKEVEGPLLAEHNGRCKQSNGNWLHAYDNGPDHSVILIEYDKKGKVAAIIDPGHIRDKQLHMLQARRFLRRFDGNCWERD